MSHFAGSFTHSPASGGLPSEPERTARAGLVHDLGTGVSADRVRIVDDGPLWMAALDVSPWAAGIVHWQPGVEAGAVAGDPIAVSGDEVPDIGRSIAIVLEAMRRQQPEGLRQARGMFAAMHFDVREKRLLLATDKLANRCLYYRQDSGRIVFATSLRLLRMLCLETERVDEQGLAEKVFLGQPLGRRTVFDGMHVLEPGQLLVCRDALPPVATSFDDYCSVPRRQLDREQAIAELHRVFSVAVRRRRMPGQRAEAFLSGGMDSRAVVAELVDQGEPVSTFCAAYPESIDDVVSRQVATAFGTTHTVWHRRPADRIKMALDPFALYAREHFPGADAQAPRAMWSGDGGSVMLGHVYMNAERVALAGQRPTADLMHRLFPALRSRPTRQIPRARLARMAELALEGLLSEFRKYEAAPPDRRLFHFYARNDQARHLYHHFESIARTRIELLTPFFDADFVALVSSLPIEWFLRHGLYNDWIRGFRCGAGDIYWQPYRGHEPCPHPNPTTASDQWDRSWYAGPEVRRAQGALARSLARRSDPLALPFVRKPVLYLCAMLGALGSTRYNYEVAFARDMFDAMGAPAAGRRR